MAKLLEVCEPNGTILPTAIAGDETWPLLELEQVSSKRALLGSYFGRGKQIVAVQRHGFSLFGKLKTRWIDSPRDWLVIFTPADADQLTALDDTVRSAFGLGRRNSLDTE